jgi:hypothetical protein
MSLTDHHLDAIAEDLVATLVEMKVPQTLIDQVVQIVGATVHRNDVLNGDEIYESQVRPQVEESNYESLTDRNSNFCPTNKSVDLRIFHYAILEIHT